MTQTKSGGIKARDSNYARHGLDHYRRIGAIGGSLSRSGGFASDKVGADGLTGRERARVVGALGGHTSRRKKYNEEASCDKDNLNSSETTTASSASLSTTKTYRCADCGRDIAPGFLDERGLCPSCPPTDANGSRTFYETRPF